MEVDRIYYKIFVDAGHGIEIYYHRDKKIYKKYANEIQKGIIKKTSVYNRGETADFVVVRETNMPAVLVEGGFLTNKNEVTKLKTDLYQDKIVIGISEVVMKYLKDSIKLTEHEKGGFKDTKGHWAEKSNKEFVIKGYVVGYNDKTFKPNQGITRVEFIKIIMKGLLM